jgi:hypothetical protein
MIGDHETTDVEAAQLIDRGAGHGGRRLTESEHVYPIKLRGIDPNPRHFESRFGVAQGPTHGSGRLDLTESALEYLEHRGATDRVVG